MRRTKEEKRKGRWWLGTGFLSFNMAGHLYLYAATWHYFKVGSRHPRKAHSTKLSTFLNGLGSCLLRAFGRGLKPITWLHKKRPKTTFPYYFTSQNGLQDLCRLARLWFIDCVTQSIRIYFTKWALGPTFSLSTTRIGLFDPQSLIIGIGSCGPCLLLF